MNSATGWLLLAGALCFIVGASPPALTKAWTGTTSEYFQTLAAHPRVWRFTNVCFLAGVALNASGVASFASSLREAGARVLPEAASTGFTISAAIWFVFTAYRLTVPVWAAQEWSRTAGVPPIFDPLQAWMGRLFQSYMVLAYLSTALLGWAVLTAGALPAAAALTAVAFALTGAASLGLGWPKVWGLPLFEPPVMIHSMPLMFGVLLILS